jgi:hypothetical protein
LFDDAKPGALFVYNDNGARAYAGKISLWRDYFDLATFTKQIS